MPDDDFIEKHFRRVGLDPRWGRKIMRVESGGDPNRVSPGRGTYKGLFQLDQREFTRHGGTGDIHDPEQNTMAAANKIAGEKLRFEQRTGRPATLADVYGVHQQGEAGYQAHLANPDQTAWKTIRKYYSSDAIAKDAIWKNMTPAMQAKYGSVDNVTSANFTADWGDRIEGVAPSTAMAKARARHEAIPADATEPEAKKGKSVSREILEVPDVPLPRIPAPTAPDFQLAKPARV